MNLNHLDVPVSDTAQTRIFFERYFGFKEVFSLEDGLTVLDGFALTLSPLPEGQLMRYPVGFMSVSMWIAKTIFLKRTGSWLRQACPSCGLWATLLVK